jgi:hypothetical protein
MQISTFAFDICTYHFKDAYVIAVIYIYITHTKLYLYNDYTTTAKNIIFKDRVIAANILAAAYDDKIKRRREYNLSIIIFYKNEIF